MADKADQKDLAKRLRDLQKKADAVARGTVECFRTRIELANHYGVNERTAARWITIPEFPPKTPNGWPKDRVEAYLEEAKLGPYRRGAHKANGDSGPTLTEASTRKTLEQAELARITKERAIVEHARELGELVAIDDVLSLYRQTVATVASVVDGFLSVKDRELPESVPSAEAWPKIRERIMELDAKLIDDIANAMRELNDAG